MERPLAPPLSDGVTQADRDRAGGRLAVSPLAVHNHSQVGFPTGDLSTDERGSWRLH